MVARTWVIGALCAVTQATVGATSGDPAVIARIRAEFNAIERDTLRFRKTTHELRNFSVEGGELVGFFDGESLRKLRAWHYGEVGRVREEFFYSDGHLKFIHSVFEHYDVPLSGRVDVRVEHRLYFDKGELIRHVRTQSPARYAGDLWDQKPGDLVETGRLLAACAAAPQAKAAACTGPTR
jgi:hypothetical protein